MNKVHKAGKPSNRKKRRAKRPWYILISTVNVISIDFSKILTSMQHKKTQKYKQNLAPESLHLDEPFEYYVP